MFPLSSPRMHGGHCFTQKHSSHSHYRGEGWCFLESQWKKKEILIDGEESDNNIGEGQKVICTCDDEVDCEPVRCTDVFHNPNKKRWRVLFPHWEKDISSLSQCRGTHFSDEVWKKNRWEKKIKTNFAICHDHYQRKKKPSCNDKMSLMTSSPKEKTKMMKRTSQIHQRRDLDQDLAFAWWLLCL